MAAQQLFESTAQLNDAAMLDLAEALRQVSAKELRDLGGGGGKAPVAPGARLFMLERLVDVTLANMHRVHRLWPEVEAHFFDIAASETSVGLVESSTRLLPVNSKFVWFQMVERVIQNK